MDMNEVMMKSQNPQAAVGDLLLWSEEEAYQILQQVAKDKEVSLDALAILVDWQRRTQETNRANNRSSAFDEVFTNPKYWSKSE